MSNLSAAGLSRTEARCYETLLSRKSWKSSELAKNVNETRTNCYKILDRLVQLGLAIRYDEGKILHYEATNPARLLELAHQQRREREQAERELELHTQSLTGEYIKTHEQAGIAYYQGLEEITQIFEQISVSKTKVRFIHTRSGDDFYGPKAMHNLRMLAVNNKIQRHALTPDTDIATSDYKTFDPTVLLSRTWLRQRDYNAPVEWGTYDDKLYIIYYGQEAMGITIQSQPIVTAFCQLFNMLESGQRAQPWYHKLPIHACTPGVNAPHLD